jgi:hypothetical protein
MKKVNWQYLIDLLLFISIAGVVLIGILLGFVLPKGPYAAESAKYFLGLHRHAWGDIHLYLGIAFTALTVIHLILGWNWIRGKTRTLFGSRWKGAIVVICCLPLIVLVGTWLGFPGDPSSYDHSHPERGSRRGELSREEISGGSLPDHEDHQRGYSSAVREVERAKGRLARGSFSADDSALLVTGQMTLRDIERETGISLVELQNRLGIPETVSPDNRLGRLRKQYGFTMQDVRSAIASIQKAEN